MRTVDWVGGKVRFLDQTRLPFEEVYVETDDPDVLADAIGKLQIRGAPAIGVAAAFGVLLAVSPSQPSSAQDLPRRYLEVCDSLGATRPTAVNLFNALDRMRSVIRAASAAGGSELYNALLQEALAIQQEDVIACKRIGELGADLLTRRAAVLTHCNAGALATAGEGTALAVIKAAARQGKIDRVFVDETRPLLQGARLTSWELVREGIPVTLITDSTAGSVLRSQTVQAVIVGADRIAAIGDVANKIGTYPLAVLAREHGVQFIVAAPVSTIDVHTASGNLIPIEERNPAEVTHLAGIRIAAPGVDVFAPAFDVTPNYLISAIVTDKGVLMPPLGDALRRISVSA